MARGRPAAKFLRLGGLGLAHSPTPLEALKRLSTPLGGPRSWAKRDDPTGIGFGGNKASKLDFVPSEAVGMAGNTG